MELGNHVDFDSYREQEHHPCDMRLILFLQGSQTYVSDRTRERRKSRTADARTVIALEWINRQIGALGW
jgi:hypothetical protein